MRTRLFLTIIILLGMISGCRTIYPVKETEKVVVKDSIFLRDTTIKYVIEKESVRDYTGMLDTLHLETSYASASAWIDTTDKKLSGQIKNKDLTLDIMTHVKERIIIRDSIKTKYVPVTMEVVKTKHPGYEPFLWAWTSITFLLLAFWIYRRFHR